MGCRWETAPLGDLLSYIGKGIAPRYVEDNANSILVLGQKCVRNQQVDYSLARFHDEEHKPVKPEKLTLPGDILINATGVGSAGRVAQIIEQPKRKCITDGHVITLRASGIDPIYLGYFIKTKQQSLEQFAEGSTGQTEMNKNRLQNEIIVTFPQSICEQRKISKMALTLDRKIAMNKRINDYLVELTEAAFVEWFVGENSRYPTKKVLMDEIASVNAGGDKPDVWQRCQTEEFPIPIYSNGIDNEGLYGYTITAKIIKPSITVSARGTIGFTCLRHEPYYPIVRLISATPKDYVTAEYLYLWVKRAKVIGVGTTQQQLTVPMFKNYAVDVPDPAGMKEFTRVTAPLFKMMDANKAENCKLSELRNALLPKLISGDVDISKVVI